MSEGPFRVKDSETGDEYTVVAVWNPDTQKVIDKPAVDSGGRHLAAKPNIARTSKESK